MTTNQDQPKPLKIFIAVINAFLKMVSINESTKHSVKKPVTAAAPSTANTTSTTVSTKKSSTPVDNTLHSKHNSAPSLVPFRFAHESVTDFIRPLSRHDLTHHINDLLRITLGGLPSAFGSATIGSLSTAPRVATSTSSMRSGAAADLALLIHTLQVEKETSALNMEDGISPTVYVLKRLNVLSKIEAVLMPNGIGSLFGNGIGPGGMNPGGGMKRIASTASLSSVKSDIALDQLAMSLDQESVASTVYSDSKKGKIVAPEAREGALLFLRALIQFVGISVEPFVIPLLAAALEECSSSSNFVREAAEDTVKALVSLANAHAYPVLVCPIVFEALVSPEWRTKTAALEALSLMASFESTSKRSVVSRLLPKIVPLVTGQVWDTKPQVSKAAAAALLACCLTNSNPDIYPAIPAVVNAIIKPTETVKAIEELKSTTFVATVDASSLSILCPVLARGLKEKMAIHKRGCCIVIENMSRLVDTPDAVAPFGPLLVPELSKVVENVQFEEIRDKALSALQALTKALGHADIDSAISALMKMESQRIEAEQARIEEERRLEMEREEEMQKKEEEERKLWREAMEAQRLLDKMALEAEEHKKSEDAAKKEMAKKSTKSVSGQCQGCGLKKCIKTCVFYSK